MSYYHTCPRCGSNLDPGEVCTDCQEKEMTKRPNLLRVSQELTAYEDPDRVLAALGAMLGKEPLPEGQIKKAAIGADDTDNGKVEHIDTVSVFTIQEN
ncbi:MAG: hypothetical protein HFE97_00075 [Oscillospiraceae bacterium]|nr:hypothetical protein [Oscillospiraceae bacterium]